jgi:hypothetical protein
MYNRTIIIHALVLGWLCLTTASGCGDETVPAYDVDCEDDGIGWELDFAGLVEPPPPEFGVECAGGWGHGVETRAASEVVELPPKGFQDLLPHPQGGLLLFGNRYDSVWNQRLGVEVAEDSLAWLDDQAKDLRWLRDDLHYGPPNVVSAEGETELWVWGYDDEQSYLSRIEPSTGELLERVVWPDGRPWTTVAAWPEEGGLWQLTRKSYDDSYDESSAYYVLQRMSSFGTLGPVLRTFEPPQITSNDGRTTFLYPVGFNPTPGGGLLWENGPRLESVADDGSTRWVLEEPHTVRVVDKHGGFLLGTIDDGGDPDDQQHGLAIQRRKLDDASLLWTRVHHRYEFAGEPEPIGWLDDTAWSLTARAEGGYLVAGGHAYPATSCLFQPIIWAIDINGEAEWAHRVETCGLLLVPTEQVEGRAMVYGYSYFGVLNHANTKAQWLLYFDL